MWRRSRLLRAVLVLFLALPPAAATAQQAGLRFGGMATANFIEGYYLNPRPVEAMARLAGLDLSQLVPADDEAAALHGLAVLGAFYAHILRAFPAMASVLADRIVQGVRPENALVAAIALRTADTPASRDALGRLGASGVLDPTALGLARQLPPFPFPAMSAESHYDVDLFWVSFFATGDVGYVDKIAQALAYRRPVAAAGQEPTDAAEVTRASQLDMIHVAAAVAAHDTLLEYGRRHALVLQELRRLAARTDELGAIAGSLASEVESAAPPQ